MLKASGLIYVDDKGIVRPGENYTKDARDAEAMVQMTKDFTNKQRDLSD